MPDGLQARLMRWLRTRELAVLIGGAAVALLGFGLEAAGGTRLHVGSQLSVAIVFAGVAGIMLALLLRRPGTATVPRPDR